MEDSHSTLSQKAGERYIAKHVIVIEQEIIAILGSIAIFLIWIVNATANELTNFVSQKQRTLHKYVIVVVTSTSHLTTTRKHGKNQCLGW